MTKRNENEGEGRKSCQKEDKDIAHPWVLSIFISTCLAGKHFSNMTGDECPN